MQIDFEDAKKLEIAKSMRYMPPVIIMELLMRRGVHTIYQSAVIIVG